MWIIVSVYLFIWSLLVTKACYLGIKKENKNFCNCPLVLLWKHEFHTLTKEGHLLVIPWDCQWPLLQGLNSPKEEFIVIDPNKKTNTKCAFCWFLIWVFQFYYVDLKVWQWTPASNRSWTGWLYIQCNRLEYHLCTNNGNRIDWSLSWFFNLDEL